MTRLAVPDSSAEAAEGRMEGLDGLRGIAVTLVILFHGVLRGPERLVPTGARYTDFAWSGVDLFFVLSGFLITRVLLDSRERANYFRNFYARRVLRIFPLYYLYLIAFVILYGSMAGPWFQVFHLSNFFIVLRGEMPDDAPAIAWSLSIEEQFYLVWPLLVRFLRTPMLRLICVSLILGALGLRLISAAGGVSPFIIYVSTPTRIDGLALGALLATFHGSRAQWGAVTRLAPLALAAGAAFVVWTGTGGSLAFWNVGTHRLAFLLTAFAFLYAGLLVFAVNAKAGRGGLWSKAISAAPLRKLGKHSFAMYLVHIELVPALTALFDSEALSGLRAWPPLVQSLAFQLCLLGATLGIAIVLWHLLEERFLRLRHRLS